MDSRPETEYGSDPSFYLRDQSNLNNMSISELVSQLRDAFVMSDFDQVEEALVAREAKLKAEIEEKKREIGSLQEKIEVEKMRKLKAEFEKEKIKVQERCDILVKKEENNVNDEKCKLAVTELKNRIIELVDEKKKWVDDSDVIAKLRDENCKLLEEKREAESMVEIWKRKFYELNEIFLVNLDALGGGKNEGNSGVPSEGNDEKKMMKIDVGSVPLKINEDLHLSKRKSPSIPSKNVPGLSGGRLGTGRRDSEEEETCKTMDRKETTSRQKNLQTGPAEPVGILKRKFAFSQEFDTFFNNLDGLDDDTESSSSGSSGSFDIDSLPLSSLTSKMKMATEAASPRLNSSSRGK